MYSRCFVVLLAMLNVPVEAQLLPEHIQVKDGKVLNTKNDAALLAAKNYLQNKNYSDAFPIFKKLADDGVAEAQARIGLMYELGQGTTKDFKAAFKAYQLASAQGVVWAKTNLALAYANGRGVAKNEAEAAKIFRQAAIAGSTHSQKFLASMYDSGKAKAQDNLTAGEWINPSNQRYIADLVRDYGSKLHFESEQAEAIVRSFDIRCQSRMDSRYLPLTNLLLARLEAQNNDGIETNTYVIERSGEARILDTFKTPRGEAFEQVVFQINKWGELMPTGSITTDAILNACFSSYGPIWLLDEE